MSSSVHPRRRAARSPSPSMTPSLIDSFQNMSLRKGDTFHHPHKHDEIWNPLASPSVPKRGTTCPKSLEELLIGAGERRAADLFARVDKAIATQSKLALGNVLSEPEVLPVPSFVADHVTFDEPKTRTLQQRHSHSSDSGIGSSIAGFDETPRTDTDSTLDHISAVTEERGLSKYANDQIHKYIVKPILREQGLKEFHPMIKDVPRKIGNKEIKTLRDLEKSLIFLAPDYSRLPSKYLQFCECTIRVLHTTVTTLHESDQKTPTDRPYTQGYFFDLVEQIRRYATILAATREKQAKGEKLDEMDYSPDESVSLQGGVTHNGKPAELVRHRNGKSISIATGRELPPEDVASGSSMKRPMAFDLDADAEDHDDVLRSMARRKKGAKPEIHECSICDKEFKRPCDLTKHVKTHERPYKCPSETCKYHEHGWPTEKERDRHVNDKHSNAPPLYHCLYKPCPYNSKRESNCKQHMEKAHGWEYVRSKNNGKGRASSSVLRLPRGSVPPSPSSAVLTPLTPIAPSPSSHYYSESSSSRRGSMPPPSGPSHFGTPAFTNPSPDFAGHFNMNFDFNNMDTGMGFASSSSGPTFPITPAMSEDHRQSTDGYEAYSEHISAHGLKLDGSTFDNAISPDELDLNTFDFDNVHFQQSSAAHNPSMDSGFASGSNAPLTSPRAQLDETFTSPPFYDNAMQVDDFRAPNEDFTLFGGSNGQPATFDADMIPSLNVGGAASWGDFGGQFNAPAFQSGDSNVLAELFPEYKRD